MREEILCRIIRRNKPEFGLMLARLLRGQRTCLVLKSACDYELNGL